MSRVCELVKNDVYIASHFLRAFVCNCLSSYLFEKDDGSMKDNEKEEEEEEEKKKKKKKKKKTKSKGVDEYGILKIMRTLWIAGLNQSHLQQRFESIAGCYLSILLDVLKLSEFLCCFGVIRYDTIQYSTVLYVSDSECVEKSEA